MSQTEEFVRDVNQDPDLRSRLFEAEDEDTVVARILEEAKTRGYDLDEDEVRERLATHKGETELSDSELEQVSGGGFSSCSDSWKPGCCG